MIDSLREKLLSKSLHIAQERFLIDAIFDIRAHFKPSGQDGVYSDRILIVQTSSSTGACFCFGEPKDIPPQHLGGDARKLIVDDYCLQIAILDAAYGVLPSTAENTYWLKGSASEKSSGRTTLIMGEVHRLISQLSIDQRTPVITMIGAVGNVLSKLRLLNASIYATDLDPSLTGKRLAGVFVDEGSQTLNRVDQSDIALVTGMTLATDTLKEIIDVATSSRTRLIMFAETGSNMAAEYIDRGFDSIIAEGFPFYMFPGNTKISIFRRPDGRNHDG